MKTLGLLEKLLVAGMITEGKYKERKAVYVEALAICQRFFLFRFRFCGLYFLVLCFRIFSHFCQRRIFYGLV